MNFVSFTHDHPVFIRDSGFQTNFCKEREHYVNRIMAPSKKCKSKDKKPPRKRTKSSSPRRSRSKSSSKECSKKQQSSKKRPRQEKNPTKRQSSASKSRSKRSCDGTPTKSKKTKRKNLSKSPSSSRRSKSKKCSKQRETSQKRPRTEKKTTKRQKSASKSRSKRSSGRSSTKSKTRRPKRRNTCKSASPSVAPPAPQVRDLGPVIKSPLDTHGYKAIRLESNGLEGLLISTCDHPLDLDSSKGRLNKATCVFNKVSEFNKKYANLLTKTGTEDASAKGPDPNKFKAATDKQERMATEWRKKVNCKRGIPDPDNEIQDARNNLFSVVLLVKSGMFHDPPDFQGLAHFCEHAIFLGSKNYPKEEAFQKFIESCGGYSNARTDPESTSYTFNVDTDSILEALDIFVDMIVNPLFDADALVKEMSLLTSEFEIKRLYEDHRYLGLLQSFAVPGHPAGMFGMGTSDTLSKCPKIVEKLKEWKNYHYTADNMVITMQGPYPVEKLEEIFKKYCSRIPRRNRASCPGPATTLENFVGKQTFNMDKWNQLYHMVPMTDTKFMYISWSLDPKYGSDHDTKPINYFMYILDQRSRGSLEWYLREQGWILSLCLTCPSFGFMYTKFHTVFSLTLELTSEGLQQRERIVEAVFSYIRVLKGHNTETTFNEIQQIHADVFHYRSDRNLVDPTIGYFFNPDSCLDCLRELSEYLSVGKEPPGEVILRRFMLRKQNPELLNGLLNDLRTDNVLVIFSAKSFECEAHEKEQHFRIRYYKRPISPELLAKLQESPLDKEFCQPKPNPFTEVSMCYPDSRCDKLEYESNLQVYKSDKAEVTYGNEECRTGRLPSAEYTIWIHSPAIEDVTELRCVPYMDVFQRMLQFVLELELGNSLNSLVSFDVYSTTATLIVELRGPSSKLPELAEVILKTIGNFDEYVERNAVVLENIKMNQIQTYESEMCDSESCAESLKRYLLVHHCLFLSDFAHFLRSTSGAGQIAGNCNQNDDYSFQDFLEFITDFKARMYIRADLNNCVSKGHAAYFAKVVDSMEYRPYLRKAEHLIINRAMKLPLGERCLVVNAKSKENRTVFVLNHYQVGGVDDESNMMLELIKEGIEDLAFEELRTKAQLGYMVDSGLDDIYGTFGLSIMVHGQADRHTCGYINEQIDEFLKTVYNRFLKTREKMESCLRKYMKPKEKLNWNDLTCFYKDHFFTDGPEFRKISIQVQGQKPPKAQPLCPRKEGDKIKEFSSGQRLTRQGGISRISQYLDIVTKDVDEENGYFITDVYNFKNSLFCFGNMQSVEDFAADFLD